MFHVSSVTGVHPLALSNVRFERAAHSAVGAPQA
jgi:hypothetical protein